MGRCLLVGCLWFLLSLPAWSVGVKASPYLLNAGDVIRIAVWHEPSLNQELAIQPDGVVSLPLAGQVDLGGKTIAQAESMIASNLTPYITEPVVSLSVVQPIGNKVFVIGQVNRPGEFPLAQQTDVLQALSKAGGLTTFAESKRIKVLRREQDGIVSIDFNYRDVSKGKALEQNIVLRAGDTVVVP